MMLLRSGARQLLRHPWQTVLAVIGVALGVGVVTAVDLANESSRRAFRFAAEAVTGKATHQVVGGPQGLPEELYRTLRVERGLSFLSPRVEGPINFPFNGGRSLNLVGIDPFSETAFRSLAGTFAEGTDLDAFLVRPATVMLLSSTAVRLGTQRGGYVWVESKTGRHRLQVCGYLQPEDEVSRQGLESVLVTDISTAQEVLGSVGRLSRIDLLVPEGQDREPCLRQVEGFLPAEASVIPSATRAATLDKMTRAFRLNLTALSLLALIVGMFLIYNTTTFSVVRRRRLIGLLRAIGVTRGEIFTLLLGEALVIGVVGTGAGLVFGALLGNELVRLVTRTINDLYFTMEVSSVPMVPATLVKGWFLGLGATVAAAIPPAMEATSAPPRAVLSRAALETRVRRLVPLAGCGGILLIGAGAAIVQNRSSGVGGSFVGLFAVIIGYALLVPAATVGMSRFFRPVMALFLGVLGRIAARGVVVSLSRTGVATAALVVAVSATLGIGIMVGSFRQTVGSWLESWLRADVYVTTTGTGTGRNKPPLDPDLVKRLSGVAGPASVSYTRRVTIEGVDGSVELLAMEIPESSFTGYRFREGDPHQAWDRFSKGEGVIISEPFAYRHQLHAGDRVVLRTVHGNRSFPVIGVFYDYGSDAGVVALSRKAYLRSWNDPAVDGMGFYAQPGSPVEELAERIRLVTAGSSVTVMSNLALRKASLAVFDRTFAITGVLRILTVVVAFVGILSALMAMQLERVRELAVLRAVGLTPAQVWGVICGETGLIGVIAGLLSLPLGIIQAVVLVYAINRRSFGWTMELWLPPELFAQAFLLSVAAALLAGLYPAWRIAAASPAVALKEE